jgi:hypothetical protein
MSAGIRILVVLGALLLFLGLRLMALLRIDHVLLGWIAGGAQAEPELVPIPVKVRPRR